MKHRVLGLAVLTLLAAGCGSSTDRSAATGPGAARDDAETEELSPAEKQYLEAARPFAAAVAAGQYEQAYAALSSHARARMSLNQFDPAENDAEFEQREKTPLANVSASRFGELMGQVVARHGRPVQLTRLHVFSTDPAVLARQSSEKLGAVDSLLAIGAMPESVPTAIRRASLRGAIRTELSATQLAEAAKTYSMTVEQLKTDPDFAPYFNLKVVLVEEEGALRVGYFEFLPPSMLD